jgi:hypothetical protein
MLRYVIRGLLVEGRIDDAKEKYTNVVPDQWDMLIEADPSGNHKYLDWMAGYLHDWQPVFAGYDPDLHTVRKYGMSGMSGDRGARHDEAMRSLIDNTKKVIEYMQAFHKYRDALEIKDIYQYRGDKGLHALMTAVRKAKILPPSKSKQKKLAKEQGADVVYEDDDWLVLYMKTWQAVCFYGAGTQWCITEKSANAWNEYKKDGSTFYYLLSKKLSHNSPLYKIALQAWVPWENRRSASPAFQRIPIEGAVKMAYWDALDNKHDELPYGVAQNLPKIAEAHYRKYVPNKRVKEIQKAFEIWNEGKKKIPSVEHRGAQRDLINPESLKRPHIIINDVSNNTVTIRWGLLFKTEKGSMKFPRDHDGERLSDQHPSIYPFEKIAKRMIKAYLPGSLSHDTYVQGRAREYAVTLSASNTRSISIDQFEEALENFAFLVNGIDKINKELTNAALESGIWVPWDWKYDEEE